VYTSLEALYQTQHPFDSVSGLACAQSDVADEVSDTSDDGEDELSMSLPTELHYCDADTQQSVAYTAFNQLFIDSDSEDIMLGVHRDDNDFNDEFELVDSIIEIGELPSPGDRDGLEMYFQEVNDFEGFNMDFDLGKPTLIPANPARLRSVKDLHSYSFVPRKSARRRQWLAVSTRLDGILEASSGGDEAPPNLASSDDPMDFSNHRGFAQPLQNRRRNFLDGEDSGDYLEVP
jgi:hypothetical protein